MTTCLIDDCTRRARARGYCQKHYYVHRPHTCSVGGCDGVMRAKTYCHNHYRQFVGPERTCPVCEQTFVGHQRRKFCSRECKSIAMRTPMRRAVDDRDPAAILAAARSSSIVTGQGCWEWQYAISLAGYPVIGQGGMGGLVHRHVMAAVVGRPLGKEPVHHRCANTRCINPDHLQVTTDRENMAEMFTRTYLTRRIADLEAALSAVAPNHELLEGATMNDTLTAVTITGTST